ncbi:MAG TPA: hypothetical protein VF069_18365 [Streptosporangiaceae bacterium]
MKNRRLVTLVVLVLAAAGMFPVVSTPAGARAITVTQSFLLFYSGVVSLVAFTGAVVWGLIAAERIVPPRYRVLAQGVHRMFGLLGLGFLGTHIVLQILAEHAQVIDVVIPFLDTRDRLVATGLGTIAAELLVVVYAVGRLRARFVNASRPWVWRIIHGIAYLSWPLSIVHGLTAGRPVKGAWVTISYEVCLGLVVVALLIRLLSPFPAARPARVRSEPPERPRRPVRSDRPDLARQPAGDRPRRPEGERPRPAPDAVPRPAARPSEPLRRPEPVRRRDPLRPVPDPRPSGPFPVLDPHPSGPLPVADPHPSGPLPAVDPRTTGPMPAMDPRPSGPMPATNLWTTGPMPVADPRPSGPMPAADPRTAAPRQAGSRPPAQERPRERLLIPDRPDARDRADAGERPRDWLDAVERFPLLRRVRRKPAAKPIVIPDIDEVEFWANLRAETAVWIRRGRR